MAIKRNAAGKIIAKKFSQRKLERAVYELGVGFCIACGDEASGVEPDARKYKCEGCGTDRGRSVECDGGGFTSSEWAEQDDDFKSDYLAGVYDRTCECCKGLRVIEVIDRDRADPAVVARLDAQAKIDAEYAAQWRAEMRMGC